LYQKGQLAKVTEDNIFLFSGYTVKNPFNTLPTVTNNPPIRHENAQILKRETDTIKKIITDLNSSVMVYDLGLLFVIAFSTVVFH
jgi:hypothetical protein